MDDFNISLVAGLDTTKSKEKINQDIDTIRKSLKDLSIQAKIDPEQVKNLEGQLDSLKVKLSDVQITQPALDNLVKQINATLSGIKIGNINIGNQGQKVGQQIGQQIGQQASQSISSAIQKGTMANLKEFKFSGKLLQNDVAKKALEDFKALGQGVVTVKEEMKNIDGKTLLNGFTINIKNAKGEIESLKYALKDIEGKTGKSFQYIGGSINDAGAIKQIKDIENAFADYTARLAQFKSTNTNILSGLTQPLADFESKLAGLKNGSVTIDEVKNAFKLLGTEASKITENFTGQLSKTDAAIRKLAQGNEIMDKLKVSFKGLNNAPKEITKELNSVSKLLQNVKKIESTEGRTANWSAEYRKWSDEVDKLKAKLSVLQKQQANMATPQVFKTSELRNADIPYMTKVSNTIEKQMVEIQKMANAKGWQKFEVKGVEETDGKIKALTLTIRDAEGALKQFTMQRAKLQGSGKAQTGLMQVGDVKVLETASQAQEKFAQSTEKANAKLAEQANKIQLSFDTGSYQSKVDSLVARTNQWVDANGNARISTELLQTALNNLGTAYINLNSSGGNTVANQQALIEAEKALDTEIKKVQSSITSMNATMAKSSAVDALRQKVQSFYDINTATHGRWGNSLKNIMSQLASGVEVPIAKLKELERQFITIQNTARQSGKLGLSFFDTIKQGMQKFSYWTSSTFLVMKTITSIKSAVSSVEELDTSLVDLKKTTSMTSSQLEEFYYTANDVAKQMGVTTKEIIDQASAWSRLGYSSNEAATKMAKYSSMFASISPGMDVDTATDGLVSIMKAFDIGNDNPDDVLDGIMSKVNIIGNTAATSNAEIVNMLSKSSSAMKEANNTLEETIALETAAVEITRDDDSVGTAFKTLSMRIRGYDEETESYTNNVEELSGKIADLTKTASTPGGISLFTDASKTEFKSTYQLLSEISKVYDQLDDKTQAQLLEALAGILFYPYVQKCA